MWHPILGSPSRLFPDLAWLPAIELRLRHRRWDAPSRHPASPGVFIDRHVARGRALPLPLPGRDDAGIFSDAAGGLGVSRASGPGGALEDPAAPGERHRRDWDFLAMHLQRAIERHRAASPLPSLHEWRARERDEGPLRAWDTCQAIAGYVVEWKNRVAGQPSPSPHPVDVLLASHHCGGTANAACALAQIAGIPARRISTSSHSTVEFLVGGQWMWSDNIRGGLLLHHGSYQDFLTGLEGWKHVSGGQRAHHAKAEVFYRSPYDYSASRWWRFGSGADVPPAGGDGDVAGGFGLSVHHDPSTADALYPGQDRHVFHGDPGGEPWITVGAKCGWIHAPLHLQPGLSVRRRFFVSACGDNPLVEAEARVWLADGDPQLSLELDGMRLDLRGTERQRHLHRAAVFAVPAAMLTPGWHEVVARGAGGLVAFPDACSPCEASASHAVRIDAARVRTDPTWMP